MKMNKPSLLIAVQCVVCVVCFAQPVPTNTLSENQKAAMNDLYAAFKATYENDVTPAHKISVIKNWWEDPLATGSLSESLEVNVSALDIDNFLNAERPPIFLSVRDVSSSIFQNESERKFSYVRCIVLMALMEDADISPEFPQIFEASVAGSKMTRADLLSCAIVKDILVHAISVSELDITQMERWKAFANAQNPVARFFAISAIGGITESDGNILDVLGEVVNESEIFVLRQIIDTSTELPLQQRNTFLNLLLQQNQNLTSEITDKISVLLASEE